MPRVMVECKNCHKPFETGQIIRDPTKEKPGDQGIQRLTCSHCGHQDTYVAADFGFAKS